MAAFRAVDTRLLLACLSPVPHTERIRAHVAAVRDWRRFLRRAVLLGVASLVYFRLKGVKGAAVPDVILAQLRQHFHGQVVASLRRRHQLGQLLAAFARACIPVIALKGAALAELVYPHEPTRPMGDLDLMVSTEGLDAADQVMRELGCRPDRSAPRSEEWYRTSHLHLMPYLHADGWVPVDIHYHIIRPPHAERLPVEDLWRRARPARLASCDTRVLAPEDCLLHLALHVALTDRVVGRLRGLTDIAYTIGRYRDEIDWNGLTQRARGYGTARHVHAALWLARELVGAEVPEAALVHLDAGSGASAIEDWLLRAVGRRAVVAHDLARSVLPPWLLLEICDILLQGRGPLRSAIAFARALGVGYVGSVRARGARPRLLTPVYVGLVHPLSLLTSAARRAVGRPEAPPGRETPCVNPPLVEAPRGVERLGAA